ncbi:MAG: DUF3343 domain-containing protein [Clostridia bacterium]|nr:DUF3343 domain-containing protein [Clostridia bacterium]
MSDIIITTGSITSAVRLKKRLNFLTHMNTAVIHTPTSINSGGCSYSVKTSLANLDLIKKLYNENKIVYKKIYSEDVINGESVFHDLS